MAFLPAQLKFSNDRTKDIFEPHRFPFGQRRWPFVSFALLVPYRHLISVHPVHSVHLRLERQIRLYQLAAPKPFHLRSTATEDGAKAGWATSAYFALLRPSPQRYGRERGPSQPADAVATHFPNLTGQSRPETGRFKPMQGKKLPWPSHPRDNSSVPKKGDGPERKLNCHPPAKTPECTKL